MTLGKIATLYKEYQSNFDTELLLKNKGITYADLEVEAAKGSGKNIISF